MTDLSLSNEELIAVQTLLSNISKNEIFEINMLCKRTQRACGLAGE